MSNDHRDMHVKGLRKKLDIDGEIAIYSSIIIFFVLDGREKSIVMRPHPGGERIKYSGKLLCSLLYRHRAIFLLVWAGVFD